MDDEIASYIADAAKYSTTVKYVQHLFMLYQTWTAPPVACADRAIGIEGPHLQALRRLTHDWLNEVSEVNPLKLISPLVDAQLSASGLLQWTTILRKQGLHAIDTQSADDSSSLKREEGCHRWVAQVESNLHFPKLQEHLTAEPVWGLYVQSGTELIRLGSILFWWISPLRAYILGLLAATQQQQPQLNLWLARLSEDWFFREQVASLVCQAFYLLASELAILAIDASVSNPRSNSSKFALQFWQSEYEHKLQVLCSIYGFELTADSIRSACRELWSENKDFDGHSIRDDVQQAVNLWLAWQESRTALEEYLAALAEQHPFPGRCPQCPK
jgi:hypothetical protein